MFQTQAFNMIFQQQQNQKKNRTIDTDGCKKHCHHHHHHHHHHNKYVNGSNDSMATAVGPSTVCCRPLCGHHHRFCTVTQHQQQRHLYHPCPSCPVTTTSSATTAATRPRSLLSMLLAATIKRHRNDIVINQKNQPIIDNGVDVDVDVDVDDVDDNSQPLPPPPEAMIDSIHGDQQKKPNGFPVQNGQQFHHEQEEEEEEEEKEQDEDDSRHQSVVVGTPSTPSTADVLHETKSTNWLPPRDVWPHLCNLGSLEQHSLDSPAPSTISDSIGGASSSICSNSSTSYEPGNHWPLIKLPYGWETAIDSEGRQYFINHQNHSTTYRKPRERGSESDTPQPPRIVHLSRHPDLGFGFVAGSERPVIVRFVKEGGPSEFVLQAGDQILEVNGIDVRDSPRERVIELIRSGGRDTVTLVVCQPFSHNRKSALLTAAKKAQLRTNPSRVRFAEGVVINGSPLFPTTETMSAANHHQCCIGTIDGDDDDDVKKSNTNGTMFENNNVTPITTIPNVLKVFLENGQTKTFRYDGNTTVQTVLDSLCEKLAIKCKSHFGLVCEVLIRSRKKQQQQQAKRNGHSKRTMMAPNRNTSDNGNDVGQTIDDNNNDNSNNNDDYDDVADDGGSGGIDDPEPEPPVVQQSSIKIHQQNNGQRMPHRLLLLDPAEMLTTVASRPNAHNLRCMFRVVVPPTDPVTFHQHDPIAFDYFYHQCCNDICLERFQPEIKYDQAIRLSSLRIFEHICSQHHQKRPLDWLESSSPLSTPTRRNLKQLDQDHGLKEFVPGTLYDSMKRKELIRLLAHSMKINRNIFETSPADCLLDSKPKPTLPDAALQAKIHFMKILSDLPCYGAKLFHTGQPYGGSSNEENHPIPAPILNDTLIVNAKYGLSYATPTPGSHPGTTMAKIEDIRSVTVVKNHEYSHDLEIHAHSANTTDGTTIRISMDSIETEEFLLFIRAYHSLLTGGSEICQKFSFLELIERSPVVVHRQGPPDWWTDGAPRYYSGHRVQANGWNYPMENHQQQQWHRVDLSVPPPSYQLQQQYRMLEVTPTEMVQSLDERDSKLYTGIVEDSTTKNGRPESIDMPSVISMEILESHAPISARKTPAPPTAAAEVVTTPAEVMYRVTEMTRILNDTDRYLSQVVRPQQQEEENIIHSDFDQASNRMVIEVDINHNHHHSNDYLLKDGHHDQELPELLRQAETDLFSAMQSLDACETEETKPPRRPADLSIINSPKSPTVFPPQPPTPYDPSGLDRFIDEQQSSPSPRSDDDRVVAELDLLCDKLHRMKSNLEKVDSAGTPCPPPPPPPPPPPIIITTTDDDDDEEDDTNNEEDLPRPPTPLAASSPSPTEKRESFISNLVIPPPPPSQSSTAQQVQEQMDVIRKFWKATDDVRKICLEPRLTPSNSSDSEPETFTWQAAAQPRQYSSLPTLPGGSPSVHHRSEVDEQAYLEILKAKIARDLSLMMKTNGSNHSAPSSPPLTTTTPTTAASSSTKQPILRSQSLNQIGNGPATNIHPSLLLKMMMNQQQQTSTTPTAHQVVSPKPPLPPGKRGIPRKTTATSPLGPISIGTTNPPVDDQTGNLLLSSSSPSSTGTSNFGSSLLFQYQQQPTTIQHGPLTTSSSASSSSPPMLNGGYHPQAQFWTDFYAGGDSTSSPGSSSSTTNMDLMVPPMMVPYSIPESKRSCFQTKEMEQIFAQCQYDIDTLLARLEEVHEKRLSSPWYPSNQQHRGLGSLTAKESLIVESRHFVTASKLFVKCATEGSFQLIDYLTECVGLLERMFTVSEDVIMAEVESQAQITCLVDRLKEVAATYAYTVDTVRRLVRHPGCPNQNPNPYLDLLMNHATSLATSLSTLMRTLRSLASSSTG